MSLRSATLITLFAAVTAVLAAQTPAPSGQAAGGVRCPVGFDAVYDASAKVLRCRKDVVSWVVTACLEKAFASYVVKPGADACRPTEIPGVGAPPGSTGSRAVACAATGYELMTDRTGERDRCERTERVFAFPQPNSR